MCEQADHQSVKYPINVFLVHSTWLLNILRQCELMICWRNLVHLSINHSLSSQIRLTSTSYYLSRLCYCGCYCAECRWDAMSNCFTSWMNECNECNDCWCFIAWLCVSEDRPEVCDQPAMCAREEEDREGRFDTSKPRCSRQLHRGSTERSARQRSSLRRDHRGKETTCSGCASM